MDNVILLGWREWLSLPELGLPCIAAKIDTGAKSSCLHTFQIDPFERDGQAWVRFGVHPVQNDNDIVVWREAPVKDQREVSDSGGHKELRYVIETTAQIGNESRLIEMTLTNRDSMRFRMLLGRTAMNGRCVVNPALSWCLGELDASTLASQKQAWRAEAD